MKFFNSQRNIWNKIAPDWYKFRSKPEERVLKFLNRQKGNIIDFGSGAGRNLAGFNNKGKLYLVDFSKEMIKLAKERAKELKIDAEFYVSNLNKTPFKSNFFDAAIFIAVLHCIPNSTKRERVVKELLRILKPGAETIVSVWNKNSSWFKNKPKEKYISWKDKGKRYYYLYDDEEIYNLFEKSGFYIKKKFAPKRNITFIVKKLK